MAVVFLCYLSFPFWGNFGIAVGRDDVLRNAYGFESHVRINFQSDKFLFLLNLYESLSKNGEICVLYDFLASATSTF